jgi:hypothetical protein
MTTGASANGGLIMFDNKHFNWVGLEPSASTATFALIAGPWVHPR